jgi:hypothetical protein
MMRTATDTTHQLCHSIQHEPHQMIGRKPLPHTRRQQKRLL